MARSLPKGGRRKGSAGNARGRLGVIATQGAVILERRSRGEALSTIADSLGISAATASQILAGELVARRTVCDAEARHLRQLELDRVDRWTVVQERRHQANGDPKAAEMLLRLQARRLALSGIRLDLSEPEAGSRGRHIVDTSQGEAGALPPFLQATLARVAALGGAVGYAAGLAQGSAPHALLPEQARQEPAIVIEAGDAPAREATQQAGYPGQSLDLIEQEPSLDDPEAGAEAGDRLPSRAAGDPPPAYLQGEAPALEEPRAVPIAAPGRQEAGAAGEAGDRPWAPR